MSTRVILRSDLSGVGKRGDIVDVADGYARNYLMPKGLALPASEGAVNQAKAMRRARDLRDAADRESAQSIASAIEGGFFRSSSRTMSITSTRRISSSMLRPSGRSLMICERTTPLSSIRNAPRKATPPSDSTS